MSLDHCFSTLYRVDAIEAAQEASRRVADLRFSTLYRVDAIEATTTAIADFAARLFQYPLSGRCY